MFEFATTTVKIKVKFPKAPPTGFALFVREYHAKNTPVANLAAGAQLMKEIGAKWTTLSEVEKQVSSAVDRVKYLFIDLHLFFTILLYGSPTETRPLSSLKRTSLYWKSSTRPLTKKP